MAQYYYLGVVASWHVLHLLQWYLLAILVHILLQTLHDMYHHISLSSRTIVALDVKTKSCNVKCHGKVLNNKRLFNNQEIKNEIHELPDLLGSCASFG